LVLFEVKGINQIEEQKSRTMSYTAVSHQEKEDKRRGAITSGVIHILLVILAILPLLTFPDPPPGQAGVLVAFGEPDAGESGGNIATAPPVTSETEPVEAEAPETPVEKEVPKKETKPKERPAKVKQPQKEVQTDKNSKERAIAKEKARAKAAAEKKLQDARDRAAAEEKAKRDKIAKAKAEAKRIADAKAAEAKRIADAKAAEAEKYRNIGRTAGSQTGGGSNNKPGNQGQTNGDINGEALDGISTGSGVLGGGISGRKIVRKPRIQDRSQNTGTVNVKVCVDAEGNVTSAKYTQGGSTTSNANLIKKAVEGAKGYKFDKTDRDTQCGTIKINFKVQ